MRLPKKEFPDKSVIALLATNTIPLFGVLFFDWDAFFIVFLYWSENLAIWFFNILKMICIPFSKTDVFWRNILIPFFALHYGGFTAGHGLFIFFIFYKSSERFWEETIRLTGMIIAVAVLFISHGISFFHNYLHKREYVSANIFKMMFNPYRRVVVMHIAVMAGGFRIISIESPSSTTAMLVVLVVMKTFLDLILHLRSHKKAQANIPR